MAAGPREACLGAAAGAGGALFLLILATLTLLLAIPEGAVVSQLRRYRGWRVLQLLLLSTGLDLLILLGAALVALGAGGTQAEAVVTSYAAVCVGALLLCGTLLGLVVANLALGAVPD
jgi:hypothetical protein